MFYIHLSVLALLSGSVYGFVTPLSLSGQRLTTSSNLASTASPEVFFQQRIAEPVDIGSVGSAASLLSDKFPEEPFVVQYRNRDIEDYNIEKRPILDLSVLKKVVIDEDSVTVEAGTVIETLASAIRQRASPALKELFYSLPASGSLSVVECAFDPRYVKLHKTVTEVKVVDADGKTISKQLSDVDIKDDIIVSITMSPPARAKSEFVARWYSRKHDDTPLPDLVASELREDVKIIIHKYGFFNDIPNVVVFVDGGRDISDSLPKDDWNEILVKTPQELWYLQNGLSEAGGFDKLTESGILNTSNVDPTSKDILNLFTQRAENLAVWIEHDKIRASFDVLYPPDVDDSIGEFFEFDNEIPKLFAMDADVEGKAEFSNRKSDQPARVTAGTVIPGFKGEVYDGVRGHMQDKRYQYATSSYDNMMNPSLIVYPLDADDVSAAIKYAANPGKTSANPSGRPFKVMGRGGGHQYCGVSCDNDALIISCEFLNRLEHFDVDLKGVTGPDGEKHDVTRELRVGTGMKLKEFAEWNNKDPRNGNKSATHKNDFHGWTIPHGECPTVGIGGHSQTGGYGHTARAFGLAIDYIYGFTIVLADGEIKTITRDSKEQEDLDIYWAVMGGSPGAFGVTTELVIHPILDEDYPHSTGFSRSFKYSERQMLAVLKILEDFINRSNADDEDGICDELDLMCSLASNVGNRLFPFLDQEKDSLIPHPSLILFELQCRDQSNPRARAQMDDIMKQFDDTVWKSFPTSPIDLGMRLGIIKVNPKYDGKKHYKLSEMSLGFTRKPPAVTAGGRENRKPFRKKCFGSKDKVTEGWAESFADLLHDTVKTDNDISAVFQVVVGGGKQKENGKGGLNSIAHRDAQLHGIVYDLFRGEDEASIKEADELATRFELEVVNEHQTQYPKVMAQWASHGDLDMNKESVWEKYYDKEKTYRKLRRIKKDVDPEDRFHSRFTVRPEE